MSGTDERGPYVAVGGEYRHTIGFSCNYVARPRVTMRPGAATVEVSMEVENLKNSPMDIMYMAHVNFRPVDNGRLVFSAPCTPATVEVRGAPTHLVVPPGHAEFLKELAADPARHLVLKPGMAYDPEAVLSFQYRADKDGRAHSMMVHPDGSASWISHRPAQLRRGVRWISRTAGPGLPGDRPSRHGGTGRLHGGESERERALPRRAGRRSAGTWRRACSCRREAREMEEENHRHPQAIGDGKSVLVQARRPRASSSSSRSQAQSFGSVSSISVMVLPSKLPSRFPRNRGPTAGQSTPGWCGSG